MSRLDEAKTGAPTADPDGPADRPRPGRPRPGRFRRYVLRPVMWALAGLVVSVFVLQLLVDTPTARRVLRGWIAERLSQSLERDVTLEDVDITLLPFQVEIWGLSVSGYKDPDGAEPLLRVPWGMIELDLGALEHRVVRLRQVRLERPRVHIQVTPDGRRHLPSLDGGTAANLELRIDRLEIDQAEILFDQEAVQLSIAGDALRARVERRGRERLGGRLAIQNVTLRLPGARPWNLTVAARGELVPGRVDVASLRLSGPHLSVEGTGGCNWRDRAGQDRGEGPAEGRNLRCALELDGETDGDLLTELGYFSRLEGGLQFDGSLSWRPGSVGWRSTLTSERLVILRRVVEDVRGLVVADSRRVRTTILEGTYGGGGMAGTIDVALGEPGVPMTLDLDFERVVADALLADQQIPVGPIASRVSGHMLYRFPIERGLSGSGRAEVEVVPDPEHDGLPLEGSFPLRITDGVIRGEAMSLRSPRQSALASGWYEMRASRGHYSYEVVSADIRELAPVLRLLPEGEPWPQWLPTAGQGKLTGELELEPDGVFASDVRLRLEEVLATFIDTRHRLSGGLRVTRNAVEHLRLTLARGDAAMNLRGRVPYAGDDGVIDGLRLAFDAVDWPSESLHPWLAFELPLDGRVTGHLDFYLGRRGAAGWLQGSVRDASVSDVPLDEVAGTLSWSSARLRVDRLAVRAPAGEVVAVGTLGLGAGAALDIDLRAAALELGAAPLRDYLPRSGLGGEVAVTSHVGGTLELPEVELEIEAGAVTLGGRTIESRPSELAVRWADGRLAASGRLLEMVTLEGGGELGPEGSDLTFAVAGQDLAGLLAVLFEEPPEDVSGSFDGALRLAGDTALPAAVELRLDEVDLIFRDRQLVSVEPLVLTLQRERLELEALYLEEPATGSELFVTGVAGWGAEAPIDLRLEGRLALDWLEMVMPQFDLEGSLDLLARMGGTWSEPFLDGQGAVEKGRMLLAEVPDFPHAFEDLSGLVYFYPEGMVIDHLDARLAGGSVRLDGRAAAWKPGEALDYHLKLRGENLRVHYPEGWLLAGDGDLTLRTLAAGEGAGGAEGGWLIQGRADLDDVGYTLDIPIGFADAVQDLVLRRRLEIGSTAPFMSAVQLNVVVDAPGSLRVKNNLADLEGSADLVLRGTLAEPIFFGTVDFEPGGELEYSSVDYRIERGRLTFSNPRAFDPEVDLVARTRVRDFDVTLTLSGTSDQLEAGFSSEPPLPALEVFELLATGGDEELEANPLRRAGEIGEEQSMSAASFLYGQAASAIGERVSDLFGFDKFRIDPLTGSGDNLSKARLTVGKRLSKDVFVSYSTDPESTEEQRFRVEWQITRDLVLVLTQNGDNSYEADARWETSF